MGGRKGQVRPGPKLMEAFRLESGAVESQKATDQGRIAEQFNRSRRLPCSDKGLTDCRQNLGSCSFPSGETKAQRSAGVHLRSPRRRRRSQNWGSDL